MHSIGGLSGGERKGTPIFWVARPEVFAADSLRQQIERTCKTRTDPDRPKIPTVGCQNSVDTSPFGNSGDRSVDETQVELLKSSVELKRSNHVEGNGRLIIVSGLGVEDLRYEFSHCRPLVSKKIIYLGENQSRHDYQTCRSQDLLVLGEARLTVRGTSEGPKKSSSVCND